MLLWMRSIVVRKEKAVRLAKRTLIAVSVLAVVILGVYYAGVLNCNTPENAAMYTRVVHSMGVQ